MEVIHPITSESMALQCSQGNALCFRNTSLPDLLAVFGDTSHLLLHFQHLRVESTSLPGKDRVQKSLSTFLHGLFACP